MTAASSPPASVTVRVPAKVNLDLRVGPLRPDGYHSLATIYQAVSLYDEVTAAPWHEWQVVPAGTYADLIPTDESNLAVRAAQLLAQDAGLAPDSPASLRISKDIPVAGGMAGGSADAAAALLACDHLWGLGHDREELSELAAELGSDVPFLLAGGNAMGSGRGEQITSVLARGTVHWVFAISHEGLSTPAVYRELDRLRSADGQDPTDPGHASDVGAAVLAALRSGDAAALGAALHNDLEPATFSLRPDLRELRDAGLEYGALGGIVSGSGPTVAFLTATHETALDLSVSLAASGMCADLRRARGPVPGAHVVTPA